MDNTQAMEGILQDIPPADENGVCGDNAAPDTDADKLSALQQEISRLQGELEKREKQQERISSEFSRLFELFPDADPSDIPNEVWDDVKNGNSLAGAYAIHARRAFLARERSDSVNERNAALSSGRISGHSSEYFTQDEVRAMSQGEVRANYKKILKSMPKW